MEDLTIGEQVKIILGRKGMTIKQLAELIETKTGCQMSRLNLTHRLGRDNIHEKDMRIGTQVLFSPLHCITYIACHMSPTCMGAR